MNIKSIFTKNPTTIGLGWGLIGGIALIAMPFFSTDGYQHIIPYPITLFASILTTNCATVKFSSKFKDSFKAGFTAFVFMSLIFLIMSPFFISGIHVQDFFGYLWRFGVVVAMGVISSFIMSVILMPLLTKKIIKA